MEAVMSEDKVSSSCIIYDRQYRRYYYIYMYDDEKINNAVVSRISHFLFPINSPLEQ